MTTTPAGVRHAPGRWVWPITNNFASGRCVRANAAARGVSSRQVRHTRHTRVGGHNGVAGEVRGVAQAARLGLVALRNRGGDAAPHGEARGELCALGSGQRGEPRGDLRTNERRILAPRDDVVVQDVAVGDEYRAAREIKHMIGGQIGVVVAGEKRDARRVICEKRQHLGTTRGGVGGGGAGARVERVAIEHEMIDTVEQRPELRQPADATGAVAVVEVGKYAGEFGGHREQRERNGAAGRSNVFGAAGLVA